MLQTMMIPREITLILWINGIMTISWLTNLALIPHNLEATIDEINPHSKMH